jgi:hypothetical protein
MIVNDESQGGILFVNLSSLVHVENHVYVVIRLKRGGLAVCLPFVSITCYIIVTTCYLCTYSLIRSIESIARNLT